MTSKDEQSHRTYLFPDTCGSMMNEQIEVDLLARAPMLMVGGTDIDPSLAQLLQAAQRDPMPVMTFIDPFDRSGTCDLEVMREAVTDIQRHFVISDTHGMGASMRVTFDDGYKLSHGKIGRGKSWYRAPYWEAEDPAPGKATYSRKRKQRTMRKNRK